MKHQPISSPRSVLQFLPSGLLALTLGVSALAQDPSSTLWYDKPAEKWDKEALPIGNGRLGAMVFGQVGSERIGLNEETMWSGSKFENDRPDAAQNLPEIRRLLSEGKNKEAEMLVDKTFTCAGAGSGRGHGAKVPFGSYQELGDLMLHFPQTQETPSSYRRSLDLANAIAAVSYQLAGVTYTREAFTSAVDQVIAVRLSADKPGSITTSIELKRVECFETTADGTLGELLMQGTLESGQQGVEGLRYACRLRAIPKGGKLSVVGNQLRVEGADELLLLVSAATNYQGFCSRKTSDPAAASTAELSAAAKKPYERLRADHIAEHRGFYDRMSLSLGDGGKESQTNAALPTDQRLAAFAAGGKDPSLAALYFNFGRYLLIGSSRPGDLPANLQGIWAQGAQTPWNGDYHLNINVQMNYWPAEMTGLGDCHMPLFKLIESLQEPGTKTAKAYYNADGWVAHVITNIWGFTSPGEKASWGATANGSAWLCAHLWDHYDFNRDKEFLAWAYPIMKGSAEFYLDMLVPDPKTGLLLTSPSNSPENAFIDPSGQKASICMGPTMDNQILRELFGNLIEASEILGIDADFRKQLAETRAKLPPNRIGKHGQIMEWQEEYQENEVHHRHVSPLYGLHPYDEISLHTTPELAKAARVTLERRGDESTGWSMAWKSNFWARLQDGDRAHRLLGMLITHGGRNLFCLHPPFQIDGNFGGASAVGEMLVQQHGDEILLLPALPSAWPEGKVAGMRVRGGHQVDFSWKDGKVVEFKIRSLQPKTLKVRVNGEVKTVKSGGR